MRRLLIACLTLALVTWSTPVSAATCPMDTTPDFTDDCYHEYVLYNVDESEIDILILPPASPYYLRDVAILKESTQMWENGINALGPAWLGSGVNLHPYSVGLDFVPEAALWDPEIVIVTGEVNPVLLAGIGLQSPVSWCHGIPPPGLFGVGTEDLAERLTEQPGYHQHGSSGMLMASCSNGGRVCFVVNTNFLWTPDVHNRRDMYDLNSHELGHCLGIGHVGDAMDFKAKVYPEDDIMSYESDGHDPGHVLCVSTLNILALERVYGNLLGQSGYPAFGAGSFVHQDPVDWDDDNCPEPMAGPASLGPLLNADPLGPYGPP